MNPEILSYIKTLSDESKTQELLLEVLGKILSKQENINNFVKENNIKINHIRDWIVSVIRNNEIWKEPRVLTINALNNTADKYFEKKNNKLTTIELNEKDEKLIADLGDYYVVQMLTPEALDNESKQMQHCIGHGRYDEKLKVDDFQYLSLRDRYNKSHITLEVYIDNIVQLRGKQNKLPDVKYLELFVSWLKNNDYQIDLNDYKLIFNKNDKKVYSKYNIPDNCEIDSILDFYQSDITQLPDNLTVNGTLNLTCCKKIEKLPKNLIVKNDLNISETNIKEIPRDLMVSKNIYAEFSELEKIPDNFYVNGDFNLSECSLIKNLPNNLNVNGNLYLNYSSIKNIPQDIKIEKSIILSNSAIEQLPDNFIVNQDLSLSDCQKLKKLPKNLTVNGNLNLYNCKNIKEIRKDLVIKSDLNIYLSGVKKMPKDLSCNVLYINKEQTDLIKESMNFNRIIVIKNSFRDYDSYTKDEFFAEYLYRHFI